MPSKRQEAIRELDDLTGGMMIATCTDFVDELLDAAEERIGARLSALEVAVRVLSSPIGEHVREVVTLWGRM